MANYADSLRLAVSYKLPELMSRPEFKHKPSAALMALLKGYEMLIPLSERERIANVKTSDQHTTDVKVITKAATTTGTARNHSHTGTIGDSKKATLSFATKTADFTYSLKGADRNEFSQAEMIAGLFLSAAIDLHGVIETHLITALNTAKSQVVKSATPYGGTWDAANFIFGVGSADEKKLFQRIKGFMRQNYLAAGYDFIHSEGLFQIGEWLAMQGGANSENLFWQLQGISGYNSQDIDTAGYEGSGYIYPTGTVAAISWIPEINLLGHADAFSVGGGFSYIDDPLGSGLKFAVHQYAAGADNSAAQGETQDVNVYTQLSVDIAPIVAPMSTANASPIYKVGLLNS